jgi:anti-anti-sigma factor
VGDVLISETGPTGNTVVTVRVRGEVDTDTGGELRGVLVGAILRRKPARIVVDLQAVSLLDPAAVGTLSAAYDAASDVHLTLVLHTTGTAVCDQLHQAGIPTCPCSAQTVARTHAA